MKKIHKAYKFRLYPTHHQEAFLNKHFGCARFVYNYFLGGHNKKYEFYKENVLYINGRDILLVIDNNASKYNNYIKVLFINKIWFVKTIYVC